MKFNIQYKKLILIILLPAISWLFFNSVYYRHLHKISSGIVISHAHPFSNTDCANSPFSGHNHSENEYILYDVLSNSIIPILVGLFFGALLFLTVTDKLQSFPLENFYNCGYCLIRDYRGPPFLV